MRLKSLFLILAASLLLLVSCKNKEEKKSLKDMQVTTELQSEMIMTKEDSSMVRSEVLHYLECLKNNKVDEALGMLYYLNDKNKIVALPSDLARRNKRMLTATAGLKYRLDYMVFHKDNDCEVKYVVILFDKKKGDNRPNEVGFILRPVRQSSKWYLTLADTQTDTVESQIPN